MDTTDAGIEFRFAGQAIEWRGPAPHVFVPLPADVADHLAENRPLFSYGWGCIPARVTCGATTVTTSLMPRDGGYLVPLKAALRRPEGVEVGDEVALIVQVCPRGV